jgi:Spy/CpxP family protein refolding chaperone
MKRKWMMVCILTLAVAFTALQGMAQTSPSQTTPPANQSAPASTSPSAAQSEAGQAIDPEVAAKVQAKLQQISTELGLSDDQKAQLKPILQDEFKRLKAVKDDTSQSVADKQEKAKSVHDSARDQMKQILTPDQQKKLAEMKGNDDQ